MPRSDPRSERVDVLVYVLWVAVLFFMLQRI
jgi:hypothetical protein